MSNSSPTSSFLSFSPPSITLSQAPTLSPPSSSASSSSSSTHYTSTPTPSSSPSPSPSISSRIEELSLSHQNDLDTLAKITDKRRSMRLRHRAPRKAQKKKDSGKIPRPMNCFMAYRFEKQKTIADILPGANHRDISKMVAKWWREEPEHIKKKYRDTADKAKEEHSQQYPDYKYAPKRKYPYNNKRYNGTHVMVPPLYLEEPYSEATATANPLVLCHPPSHHYLTSPYPNTQPQPYIDQQHYCPHPYEQQPEQPQQQVYQWSTLQPPTFFPDNLPLWNSNIESAATTTETSVMSIASHEDPMFSSNNSTGNMSNYCPSPSPPLMYDSITTAVTSVLGHEYTFDQNNDKYHNAATTEETAADVRLGPNYLYYNDFVLLDQD